MKNRIFLAAAVFCVCITVAGAEDIRGIAPGAIQKRSTDILDYYNLEKKLKEKRPEEKKDTVIDKTGVPSEAAPAEEQRIFISKVVTDPSDILSESEIREITGKYEGKEAGMKDLFEIINNINKLYAAKNYVAARAILPPQKVEGGVVKIRLIEGRIGDIQVENNRQTKETFVTDRISLKKGDHIRLDSLGDELFFLNSTNDIRVTAELKAGKDFGTTDLSMKVEEPQQYEVTLFTDNAGRDTTGLYRAGLILNYSSLLGYRDPLTIGGIMTDGTQNGFVSYNFPVNTLGTRVGASFNYNEMDVVSGAFRQLDINGHSQDLGVSITHPITVKPGLKADGFLEFHAKRSTQKFSDVTMYVTNVSTVDFGLNCLSYDAKGLWYARISATSGLHAEGGDWEFWRFNLFAIRQQNFTKDIILTLRASGQVSDTKLLPPTEQFFIGGISTVKGYPEGLLSGDQGYAVSAELSFPLPFSDGGAFQKFLRDKVKGLVFVDHGGAFPYKGNSQSIDNDDFLTSIGTGLNLNFSKYLSGKVLLALPLQNRENEQLIHFYLQSVF